MDYPEIAKPVPGIKAPPPNLKGEDMTPAFDWRKIEEELGTAQGDQCNLAYLAIDRHCSSPRRDKIALYWEGKHGEEETYTFGRLMGLTNQFANVLAGLGVLRGDRVFVFAERIPELYVAVFGTLKFGAVVGPIFSAFGPGPVKDRLLDSGAKVLVTTPEMRNRISSILNDLPELKHIIIIDRGQPRSELNPGEINYHDAMSAASPHFQAIPTMKEDYSIIHYTSGTTGKPKGAMHVHQAGIQHYATGKWVLDLHQDDIYWCTADPGWVTGTSYGMSAPWTNGVAQVIYEGGFGAKKWYSIIEKYKVTVWYTAPTALRMLMKAGEKITAEFKMESLRHVCSVGEPLNPEVMIWGLYAYHQPIHDTWWQTETGGIMISNYPFMTVRPGSMGKPIPGVTAAILGPDYKELPPDREGLLAVKPGWPGMFRTYWKNEELYKSRFKNGWYMTGDRAQRDKEGYFWFIGRADDVINTAGHLVGPFEVESVLLEHPAVAEAGVIGKPDPLAMEVVKAFVSLKDGYAPTDELRQELLRLTRKMLSAGVAPREIEFLPSLPKNRAGKIMRRLLKAKEMGLPLGDTSTMDDD